MCCAGVANNFTWKANEIFNTLLRHINEGFRPGQHPHTHAHARSYPDRAIHLRQSSLAGTEAAAGTAAGQQMSLDTPISNEWMPEHSAASSYVIHLRFTGSAMVGPASLRPAPNTGSGFGSVWHGRKYLPSRRVFACLGDNWKSNKGLACSLCSHPCYSHATPCYFNLNEVAVPNHKTGDILPECPLRPAPSPFSPFNTHPVWSKYWSNELALCGPFLH